MEVCLHYITIDANVDISYVSVITLYLVAASLDFTNAYFTDIKADIAQYLHHKRGNYTEKIKIKSVF